MTTTPSERAMVAFLDVDAMMRLVHAIGLETMLVEMADAVEADFRRWPEFEKTPRLASHSAGGVIELMPVSDGEAYAFKYVNGHPRNAAEGLQTVAAFGVLSDVATGYPVLISEMTILTALRTAATSAMAARCLARPGSRVMAMIGNGAQSEFQALAFRRIVGIEEVRLHDVDPAATAKCAANLEGTGLRVVACGSVGEAVQGADVITTCTADKRAATVLGDNAVGRGVHLNAIGGDCPGKTELAEGILRRAEIFVEHAPQTRVEGEIQQLDPEHPVTELWRVFAGEAPGRSSADAVTLFDGVGFAVEDFTALRYVDAKRRTLGIGRDLDLLADPDETRDLYGMLMRAAP